jgi:drug/metabolite transporter (DMT)-like permease
LSQAQALKFRAGTINRWQAVVALSVALFAAGAASVLIRLAQEAGVPTLAIVPIRLTLATILLTPIAFRYSTRQFRQLRPGDIFLGSAAGFWLTVSFVAFFSALEHTSVLIANVLDGTSPLWIAVLEIAFLKARFGRNTWIGLVLVLLGGFVIAIAGNSGMLLGDNPVLGSILAATSALTFSIYAVIGRKSRQRVGFVPYIWLVFFSGMVTAAVIALLTHTPITGYSAEGYFWVVALTIVAQLVFHPAYNFALKYLPATFMSILGQTSVIVAAVLGMIVFGEMPGWPQIGGGVLIATGVTLASLAHR